MARAQLRADQIRDPDVLTEAEHLALVHQNLTTSGTLTVDNASVTGFTIEYSNDDIVLTNTDPDGDVYIKATNASSQVKTGIHIQPDASTALYHAGVAAARTYGNGGLQYFKQGAAGTSGYIYDKSGVGFTMQSATGETIAFHHVNEPMAVFTADGAIKLYHDGSLALETTTTTGIDVTGEVTATTYYGDGSNLTGISSGSFDPTTVSGLYFNDSEVASSDANGIATQQITDGDNYITLDDSANRIEIFTAGNKMVQIDNLFTIEHGDGNKGLEVAASYIDFYGATAARRFQLYPHDTLTRFVNTANSSEMVFQSNNSSSVQKDMLRLDPDGYSILSYAGDTRFYTDIDGVSLSANGTYLAVVCDEHAYITNSYNGGSISLQGDNSSNVRKYVFIGYPDDYSAMFHAGAKVLSTVTSGIRVHRADDPKGLDIIMGTSDCTITNREHGGLVIISSENSIGTEKQLISMNPDGEVKIKHAGEDAITTLASGIEIPSDSFMYFGDTTTSGSWRMGISGEDFVHQKYNGSTWETKQTVVG